MEPPKKTKQNNDPYVVASMFIVDHDLNPDHFETLKEI